MPTVRTPVISSTAVAALVLTGSSQDPVRHGEAKLRDGDRTGWIKVSKNTYDTTDLHDHV